MKYADYNEKKTHGSSNFPIQYYYVDAAHAQYIMPLHWHKEFEIIHILSGVFRVFMNNIEYTMQKGDIVFVECGTLHRGEPDNCVYECVVFDINMIRKHSNDIINTFILPLANREVTVNCFLAYSNNILHSTVNSIFSTMKNKKKYYELDIYSLLFKLFFELYADGYIIKTNITKRNSHQIKMITQLLDWIESNYTEAISLHDLSVVAGMNEKYLCRLFREYTSKTPIDYINNLRIESACHEMAAKHMTVTEAALNSGFNNLSYFSKMFKKYKNITPAQFRKMNECH